MRITEAFTNEQLKVIEALARQIVPDFYAPFFERATAEYLVESGHTVMALAAQMGKGCRHFLIETADRPVGYFSLAPGEGGVLLSHFYVLGEYRGRGLGQLAMTFIDGQVTAMGAERIELFVLRENTAAVGLYHKNGYAVAEEVLTRLGNGAVLEDYLCGKRLNTSDLSRVEKNLTFKSTDLVGN
jgi:ribosomal protein S18 acetylase RimI-like enzyme